MSKKLKKLLGILLVASVGFTAVYFTSKFSHDLWYKYIIEPKVIKTLDKRLLKIFKNNYVGCKSSGKEVTGYIKL